MKKLKFLPTILMLVLCVGVLAIGIYAAGTTTNQIQGTITINASNLPIGIKAYKIDSTTGTWATTPFFSAPTVRSGTDITLGDDLEFDLASINSEDDFEDLDIRIKIVIINPNNVKLGAYFSNTVVSQNAYDNPSQIAPEKTLTTTKGNSSAVKAVNSGYKVIPAKDGTDGENELLLTFKISDFIDADSINLENPSNKMYLNVEEAKDYTVYLNACEGSFSNLNGWIEDELYVKKDITFGESYGTLPTVSAPDGTVFSGWFGMRGTNITDNQIKLDTETEFEAGFATQYSINLNANGGTLPAGVSSTATLSASQLLNTTPTRSGYVFNGWIKSTDENDNEYVIKQSKYYFGENKPEFVTPSTDIQENATYLAVWGKTANDVWVSVLEDSNECALYPDGTSCWSHYFLVTPGEKYGEFIVPDSSLDYYSFARFNTKIDGNGIDIGPDVIVDENATDHVVYSIFEAVKYTWTFECSGGSFQGVAGIENGATQYETDPFDHPALEGAPPYSEFDSFPVPTRSGYTFAGWVDENGYNITTNEESREPWDPDYCESSCTFTATWTAN